MNLKISLIPFIYTILISYIFLTAASPLSSLSQPLANLSPIPSNISSILNTTSLALPSDDNWPFSPYTLSLPHTPYSLLLKSYYTPVLGLRETTLFLDVLSLELEFLDKYPQQFSTEGISVTRSFTDIFLTCHRIRSSGERKWTIEVAMEMLRMLGAAVEEWGVRGLEFELVEGGRERYSCRVWAEEEPETEGERVGMERRLVR
ncbi:hypothetical protein ACLMJK_008597 [Lecanora helva]